MTPIPSPRRRLGPQGLAVALLVFAVAVVAVAIIIPVQAHKDGHLPAEGCDCHAETPSPAVTILVEGWPTEFAPDKTYHLKVSTTGDVPGNSGGFSMDVSKGHLESSDPAVASFGKAATHANADQRVWNLDWIAPPEDSGAVHLIVYANVANGDGREGEEDHWNLIEMSAAEKAPEPPKPSNLVLAFSGNGTAPIAGQNVTITATLTNFTGAPIPKATITFFQNTSYGNMAIGSNVTGPDGRAPINLTVVAACECSFFAHYDGSSKNLSTNGTGIATITDPANVFDTLYPPPSAHVFASYYGVASSIGVVVVGVWLTLGYAAFTVAGVRSAGTPSDDGPRGLIRLITGRQEKEEKK
ncbi:MAG: Ig-like domain-containing protein [Candidatus Thermoplasmatota archaeon]